MKNEMKQLFLFIVLLIVFGVAGFLYRATLQAPTQGTNVVPGAVACTADAKVCPDGTSIGRSGPSCQFAACTLPNIEIPEAGLGFVLPRGFATDENAYGADLSLIGAFMQSSMVSTTSAPDSVIVRRYDIPVGKDANSVMLAKTMYESSGNQPKSMSEFKPVIINGKTYQMIVVERFEAMVHVVYYLPRQHDVLRFEGIQHDVKNWSDPSLNVRTLSTIAAVETMLGTVQSNEPGT
jgi:hypothetical protein